MEYEYNYIDLALLNAAAYSPNKNQNFNSRTELQARETKKLIYWMITEGQQYAPALQYAKLPPVVAKQAEKILDSIHYAGKVL